MKIIYNQINQSFLKAVKLVFCLFAGVLFTTDINAQSAKNVSVTSPDGRVRVAFSINNGLLNYTVTKGSVPVILPSPLILVTNSARYGMCTGITIEKKYTLNNTYPINGVHSTARNYCKGAILNLSSQSAPFALEVRVFNNGAAFKYIIKNTGDAVITQDSTGFNLPAGTGVWSQSNIKYYEGQYTKKDIAAFKPGDLAGPPVTLELPGKQGFAAITEAGLVDFAGMSLRADGHNGFTATLTGDTKKTGNFESPWRVIEVGDDLNTLVNCDIVTNVSLPPDPLLFPEGNATGWVKPGRSVWSWLADKREITLDNMKHFSDLAAELGFEYNLVDEGWGNWKSDGRDKWDMMRELVDYSAKKGVKIWVWKAYPDRNGIPGINTPEKRLEFFKKCKELGVVGLKVDFFDSEAQEIVDFYQDALKEAARFQLMMDFHGANKPTGENRTWPNELTREAIRGLENRAPWAPGNTTLPFTRYLAGPADFTPVHFGNRLGEVSWAHQVATMVVFTSPLMCLGADPQSILNNPCKQMIQIIPVTWDETIVLPQSKIGELALYARRKGNTWFLAGLSNADKEKELTIDLTFLKNGNYHLTTIKDNPNLQADILLEQSDLAAGQSLHVRMNKTGGFVTKIDSKEK